MGQDLNAGSSALLLVKIRISQHAPPVLIDTCWCPWLPWQPRVVWKGFSPLLQAGGVLNGDGQDGGDDAAADDGAQGESHREERRRAKTAALRWRRDGVGPPCSDEPERV